MTNEEKDFRKVKILRVDPQTLLDILNWQKNEPPSINLPVYPLLPKDIIVLSVNSDWKSHSLELLIYHESFPICEINCDPPIIPSPAMRIETIEIKITE